MFECLNDIECLKGIKWIKKFSSCKELGCYKASEYMKNEFVEPEELMKIFMESVELYNKFLELNILTKINEGNIDKYIKAIGYTDKMVDIYASKIEHSEMKEGLTDEQKKSICARLVYEYI